MSQFSQPELRSARALRKRATVTQELLQLIARRSPQYVAGEFLDCNRKFIFLVCTAENFPGPNIRPRLPRVIHVKSETVA